jgi:hypothetical protein
MRSTGIPISVCCVIPALLSYYYYSSYLVVIYNCVISSHPLLSQLEHRTLKNHSRLHSVGDEVSKKVKEKEKERQSDSLHAMRKAV